MMETPSHLTCPYCPSQAFPTSVWDSEDKRMYECPAHHTFYIEKETDEHNDDDLNK